MINDSTHAEALNPRNDGSPGPRSCADGVNMAFKPTKEQRKVLARIMQDAIK
jgi:hypothetical protein